MNTQQTTSKISDKLKGATTSLGKNYKVIIIIILCALFILAAYYVFKNYVQPKINKDYKPNREFDETVSNQSDVGVADVYMFKVDWCPHCKKALPIWEDFSSEYQDKKINGYRLNFILVDGEAEPDTTDKFNIEGYPTIKLVKDNQIIEYDAKPDRDTLLQFLNSTL